MASLWLCVLVERPCAHRFRPHRLSQARCFGHSLWICKPAGLFGGKQINLEHVLDIPAWIHKKCNTARKETWVIQKYVEHPLCVWRQPPMSQTQIGLSVATSDNQKQVRDENCTNNKQSEGNTNDDSSKDSNAGLTKHKVDFRLFVFVSEEGVFCLNEFIARVSPLPFTDLRQHRGGSTDHNENNLHASNDEIVKPHLTNTYVWSCIFVFKI